MIRFNKPYCTGKELEYINSCILEGRLSGNGVFTKQCQRFIQSRYNINKALLTTSCTDALEMAAILCDIKAGDEVIVPSFTFVSSANAFILHGAKCVFADSYKEHPNVDPKHVESLITSKTKAIVVVHYAGVACDMEAFTKLAQKHNLYLIEDAAQCIEAYYKDQALGAIGDLGAFSFHETKNIISGEGGALLVNNKDFQGRSEIIWEKGTNRAAFYRGEVNKYGWVDKGSSFLPSELTAAFLYAQLEQVEAITKRRVEIWNRYYNNLKDLDSQGVFQLPKMPPYAQHNGHLFHITCNNLEERTALINHLKAADIHAVFHYLSLHESSYYQPQYQGLELPNSDRFTDCLLRLPLYFELENEQIDYISEKIHAFFI